MNHTSPLPNVDWYIDLARKNSGIESDGKLSTLLGLARVGVSNWRCRRSFPDEQHMIRLCELAGVDPQQGLLDLARWRAKGKSADVWAAIRAAVVASLVVMLFAYTAPVDVNASEMPKHHSVYYG